MSPRTKEQYEIIRQESKRKILDSALEVFAKHGYHSASVSIIAEKAGIAKGLIYNYFRSKEDVLNELMIGMIIPYIQEIFPFKPGQKMTRDDMVKLINKTVDLVLEKPDYWKLYMGVFVQPDVMPKLMNKMWAEFAPILSVLNGYFRSRGESDPAAITRYFFAILDGVQLHIMVDPENFPAKKIKKLLIKQFA